LIAAEEAEQAGEDASSGPDGSHEATRPLTWVATRTVARLNPSIGCR
jgi:hypothetical protein